MRYRFSDCVLDAGAYTLTRAGTPVPVEPQVFDLLCLLAENAGQLVTKDALVARVWDGRIVSEATISGRINAARTAVGDTGKAQAVIRTVPRRGFELVAPTTREEDASAEVHDLPAPRSQTIRYTTSRDGALIAWSSSGEGPPLVRSGHQFTHLERDWTSAFFQPHFEALCARHRLIRFDTRGTGLSESKLDGADLDRHVEDFSAVIEAAGLDRFDHLTTLQNTAVSVRYIARNPGRVRRLVIQTGYARGRAHRGAAIENQELDPFLGMLRSGAWGDPTNGFTRAWVSAAFPSLTGAETTRMVEDFGAAASAEDALATRLILDRFDARADMAALELPVLVIHARACAIHPLQEGRLLAAGIKGAEFIVFDSANVVCVASDPTFADQNRAILEFFDRA